MPKEIKSDGIGYVSFQDLLELTCIWTLDLSALDLDMSDDENSHTKKLWISIISYSAILVIFLAFPKQTYSK